MADKILHKKSSIEEKIPNAGILDFGEIAINMHDGNMFFRKTDDTIAEMKRLDVRLNETNISNIDYDDLGNMTEITYSSGNIVKFEYDSDFNLITSKYYDISGEILLYTYIIEYLDGNVLNTSWVKA